MRKKLLAIIIFTSFVLIGVVLFVKSKNKEKLEFYEVKRGTIKEEVTESGLIEKGELINVYFEIAGKVEKIFVSEGENVEKGEMLAKLDDKEAQELVEKVELSLEGAKKILEKLNLQYQQLERGDQKSEILENGMTIVREPIEKMIYTIEEVENLLFEDDLEAKKENIRYYCEYNKKFADYPKILSERLSEIKEIYQQTFNSYQKAKIGEEGEKEKTIELGYKLFSRLAEINKISKEPIHYLKETILDLNLVHEKEEIIENHFSLLSQLENQFGQLSKNLLTILNKLKEYEDQLKMLNLDLQAQQLQVEERKKTLEEVKRNLEKHYLRSPTGGTISKIYLKEGEMVDLLGKNLAFQILPDSPFEIKVDIYEKDISKIKIGQAVEISFSQFPEEIFKGMVSFISPTSKIKEGVVYYEVKIQPLDLPENVFSGMTCDLKIIVEEKENVLILTREALKKKEGRYFVETLEGKKKIEKEVGVGILGEDFVEILSGLEEGEKVILP